MSTWRPKTCRDCPASVDNGDTISKQGYCNACGLRRTAEAIEAMMTRDGERYRAFIARRHPDGNEARRLGVGGSR